MSDIYRFGAAKDSTESYADGTSVPHRLQDVERQHPDGTWEVVGYMEIHIHKVTRGLTDVEDISFGLTARANPKRTV